MFDQICAISRAQKSNKKKKQRKNANDMFCEWENNQIHVLSFVQQNFSDYLQNKNINDCTVKKIVTKMNLINGIYVNSFWSRDFFFCSG